jgi:hypothetical protein
VSVFIHYQSLGYSNNNPVWRPNSTITDDPAGSSLPPGTVQWRMAHLEDLKGANLLLCTRLGGNDDEHVGENHGSIALKSDASNVPSTVSVNERIMWPTMGKYG